MTGKPPGPYDFSDAESAGEKVDRQTAGGQESGKPRSQHGEQHQHDVGSVSEETAKLLGALGDWAKDHGQSYAGAAAAGAAGLSEALRDVDRHVATGAEECRYCPVCLVVSKIRTTSPEVRQHLSSATTSLLAAVAGMLATQVPEGSDRRGPVERIDLGEEAATDRRATEGEPAATAGEKAPWWTSQGAQPHEAGPDRWQSDEGVQHAAASAYPEAVEADGFETDDVKDLAADPPRTRRTRRPCIEEEPR